MLKLIMFLPKMLLVFMMATFVLTGLLLLMLTVILTVLIDTIENYVSKKQRN